MKKKITLLIVTMMLMTSFVGFSSVLSNASNPHNRLVYESSDSAPVPSESSWWDANWKYRKPITIDHTKVAGNVTNFPVLIHNTSLDFAIHAQPDGDDFVFTTLDDLQLNHEIEYFNNTSGELVAWVNIPYLSCIQDSNIYIYYGNSNCSNQQTITWDSNYSGVWHLKESLGTRYDSTSNHKDCTASGTNHTASAKINGGEIYDVAPDMIYTNSNLNDMSTYTMECWVAFDSPVGGAAGDTFMCMPVNNPAVFRHENKIHVWLYGYTEAIESNHTFNDTDWHYVVLVATGSELQLFVDSILEGIYPWSDICYSNSFYLGDNQLGTDTFTGIIDEARISNCARNVSWINTSYNSMNSPETFMNFGDEEILKEPSRTAFIFGKITNRSYQGEYITFEAVKTRVITFSPFNFITYVSGEKFIISKKYQGFIGAQFIFALAKVFI